MLDLLRNPLIAFVLIGFGVLLIYGGHKNGKEIAALQDHGLTAKAQITDLQWAEKKASHQDNDYSVQVSFKTKDGREIQQRKNISTALGRSLRNGDVLPVMSINYLPESPTSFRDVNDMDGAEEQGDGGRFMLLLGIVMLFIGFFTKKKHA